MATFDVNTDAVIAYTAKLERLHRSAFPSAVRNTLNDAAFEAKSNVPKTAAKKFVTRQKTFLKRFSTVEKAQGFNVNTMASKAGISTSIDPQLAENLEAQEKGGTVQGKKLIPHDHSRVSRNQAKRVSSKNYLNKVKAHNATKAYKAHGGTRNSKFVAAIMSTAKSGKKHMLLQSGSSGMVYELNSVSQNRLNRKINFKIKKLYSVRNTRTHKVSSTGFMRESGLEASKKMNKFYVDNAEFQFKKFLK